MPPIFRAEAAVTSTPALEPPDRQLGGLPKSQGPVREDPVIASQLAPSDWGGSGSGRIAAHVPSVELTTPELESEEQCRDDWHVPYARRSPSP